MKYEWKKQEKALYGAKGTPSMLFVPRQSFLTISGKGNPNDADFSNRVSVLFSMAYAIKMGCKLSQGDFAVYPLEGLWSQAEGASLDKDRLEYTIMIRQPEFVSEEMVCSARARVNKKKPSPLLDQIHFVSMEDGRCIEVLHIGSYDDEPASFAKMDDFAKNNGLTRKGCQHREIYLNNAGRVEKSKLKTILRYMVN